MVYDTNCIGCEPLLCSINGGWWCRYHMVITWLSHLLWENQIGILHPSHFCHVYRMHRIGNHMIITYTVWQIALASHVHHIVVNMWLMVITWLSHVQCEKTNWCQMYITLLSCVQNVSHGNHIIVTCFNVRKLRNPNWYHKYIALLLSCVHVSHDNHTDDNLLSGICKPHWFTSHIGNELVFCLGIRAYTSPQNCMLMMS